jgi:molybdate transport system ATP-binding protein
MSFEVRLTHQIGNVVIALDFASKGGLTALFGPSGVGKSSILNMVAGLIAPDTGRIVVGDSVLFDSALGINVPVQQRRAGYVFQDTRLFPHLCVRDNLLYGWKRTGSENRMMTLEEVTGVLGIAPLLDRYPRTLSGGEAQRVAIGRALLSGPRFLLMDEPLSSLDSVRAQEILGVIERLRDELKLPILYVSHDRGEVERLAGTIVSL